MKQSCSNKQNYFDKQRCSDKQMLKTCIPFAILEGEKKYTGILRFTLLMWGHIKNAESENSVNRGYLVVSKGRKIGYRIINRAKSKIAENKIPGNRAFT